MTDVEKIEALREWLGNQHPPCRCMICIEILNPIRDIIDPPKPKWRPKWREMVDEASRVVDDNPLERALMHLSVIASDPSAERLEWNLARIVAICEAQVGDGWQADPEREPDANPSVDLLLNLLSNCKPLRRWRFTADAAAKWLRSLTDGGAA